MTEPTNSLENFKLNFEYQEDDLVFEKLIKRINARKRLKSLQEKLKKAKS